MVSQEPWRAAEGESLRRPGIAAETADHRGQAAPAREDCYRGWPCGETSCPGRRTPRLPWARCSDLLLALTRPAEPHAARSGRPQAAQAAQAAWRWPAQRRAARIDRQASTRPDILPGSP